MVQNDNNIFPSTSRLGCLDAFLKKKKSLKWKIIIETNNNNNFLFFYQFMLLIYNTEKSSIHDDKRLSHCAEIEECGPICMYDMSD